MAGIHCFERYWICRFHTPYPSQKKSYIKTFVQEPTHQKLLLTTYVKQPNNSTCREKKSPFTKHYELSDNNLYYWLSSNN